MAKQMNRPSFFVVSLLFFFTLHLSANCNYGEDIIWPTENDAFVKGSPPERYIQATESGRIVSGEWGCTRNSGSRFHEGIDLKSINRTAKGVSADKVRAIAAGRIVHVNRDISESSYGKYVVIIHREINMQWCSLYAHLESIQLDVTPGKQIKTGEVFATMGHTSSTINIPESRAHLHLETGFLLNTNFQNWYDRQGYKSENDHRQWNGINIVGFNPIDIYQHALKSPTEDRLDFILKEPFAFELLIHYEKRPDFLIRNARFLRGKKAPIEACWYSVGFTWYGLPTQWTPIASNSVDLRMKTDQIYVRSFKHEKSCRNWIDDTPNGLQPTKMLLNRVELLKTR